MNRFRACLCILLFLALCGPVHGQALKKATFIPQWSPQSQFAGFYVAFEKGFYREHGIDLNILRGGPERPPEQELLKCDADFTTMFLVSGIELRTMGMKIVNIGQIAQRSDLALLAKKSSGIRSPWDLNGKTLAVWPQFEIQPRLFFLHHGLDIRTVPQTGSVSLFLRGGVDAMTVMLYNEYHTLLNSGLDPDELQVFPLSDAGFNFPEDGIYCRAETLARDPDLCRAFVLATIEGWNYAFEHPEEALDIVMKYVDQAHLPTNRVHQKWMLDRMRGLILPTPETNMGSLSRADYLFVTGELIEHGVITMVPDYEDFHVDLARRP